ncbi:MAG: sulfite exporter TauE/SafE family protein [Candidatus Shapirobacteria bacterium]|nr:sulfite exporter TauE/SafE family protein [Candidatus Shapirobacteria bacterium]
MKQEFLVKGLHCKSCEILIEEKLANKKGIKKADVILAENKLIIEAKKKISLEKLNKWFEGSEYIFGENFEKEKGSKWWILGVVVIAGLFILLGRVGWSQFININSQTSWIVLFLLGIVAGFSTCGALLSGMVVSFGRESYKIILGRILSYTVMGGLLGYTGEKLALGGLMNGLMIVVSLMMIVVAMQMLGIKWANKIGGSWSKQFSKKIVNNNLAWVAGLLAVFLPCGFTLLAEGSAMVSGSLLGGSGIMLMFATGSSIPLWLIGKGIGRIKNQKAVGLLVLFFVFYNLWFWMMPQVNSVQKDTVEIKTTNQDKVKVIKLQYTAFGLSPYQITVNKGEKVRLEIEVKESQYGCMSTILLPGMFAKPQTLTKGKTLVMEFTPNKVGIYKFVCAMGVPHKGEINVVE